MLIDPRISSRPDRVRSVAPPASSTQPHDQAVVGVAYQADDPTGVTQLSFDETVKAHLSGIINYVETHITNAILESINNKIQISS